MTFARRGERHTTLSQAILLPKLGVRDCWRLHGGGGRARQASYGMGWIESGQLRGEGRRQLGLRPSTGLGRLFVATLPAGQEVFRRPQLNHPSARRCAVGVE